jgi:2-iminobutanoate/2-iminopropanoate deaminase
VGAGSVEKLVFLGQIGAGGDARATLRHLGQALARRALQPEDLLRLRIFVVDLGAQAEIERTLEELLPRSSWPAMTIVELPADTSGPRDAVFLDAIAAPAVPTTCISREPPGSVEREQGEERWSPRAVRYGPWVFVGALVGASPRARSLSQRIDAQSRSLFARMEQLLRAAGAELGDVVKVGGWLSFPMCEYKPLGEVRSQLLARRLLPASAAVQIGRVAGESEPLLSFEAIAYAPQGEMDQSHAAIRSSSVVDRRKTSSRVRGMAKPSPLAEYYATARHAGGYVFTCGEIPRTPAGTHVRKQAGDVYEQLGVHLGEYGANPADVVHQTVFVRNREDIPEVQAAGRAFRGSQIPTTIIHAADMGFRHGVDVEVELIAESSEREGV